MAWITEVMENVMTDHATHETVDSKVALILDTVIMLDSTLISLIFEVVMIYIRTNKVIH